MQTEMTIDRSNATDKQAAAMRDAHRYIEEDRDTAVNLRMITDFTLRVDQKDRNGEIVRTWIAYPSGRLTWKS